MIEPWDKDPKIIKLILGDYDVLIKQGNNKTFNGYIGLPKEHYLNGYFYDEIPVKIHGELTYSTYTEYFHNEYGCSLGKYWIGFNTSNPNRDYIPTHGECNLVSKDQYKDQYFMLMQLINAIHQLKELQNKRL